MLIRPQAVNFPKNRKSLDNSFSSSWFFEEHNKAMFCAMQREFFSADMLANVHHLQYCRSFAALVTGWSGDWMWHRIFCPTVAFGVLETSSTHREIAARAARAAALRNQFSTYSARCDSLLNSQSTLADSCHKSTWDVWRHRILHY